MAPAPLAYRWAPIMCTCHGLLSEAWTNLGSAQDCVRPAQERPPLSPHPKCARDGGTHCAREIAGLLAILCTDFLQTGSRLPGVLASSGKRPRGTSGELHAHALRVHLGREVQRGTVERPRPSGITPRITDAEDLLPRPLHAQCRIARTRRVLAEN